MPRFICGSSSGVKLILYVLRGWLLPAAAATLSGILSFPIITNFHNTQHCNGHNNPFYIEYKNPITFDASPASLWRQIKMEWAPQVVLFVTLPALPTYFLSCSSSFIVVCLSVIHFAHSSGQKCSVCFASSTFLRFI